MWVDQDRLEEGRLSPWWLMCSSLLREEQDPWYSDLEPSRTMMEFSGITSNGLTCSGQLILCHWPGEMGSWT